MWPVSFLFVFNLSPASPICHPCFRRQKNKLIFNSHLPFLCCFLFRRVDHCTLPLFAGLCAIPLKKALVWLQQSFLSSVFSVFTLFWGDDSTENSHSCSLVRIYLSKSLSWVTENIPESNTYVRLYLSQVLLLHSCRQFHLLFHYFLSKIKLFCKPSQSAFIQIAPNNIISSAISAPSLFSLLSQLTDCALYHCLSCFSWYFQWVWILTSEKWQKFFQLVLKWF